MARVPNLQHTMFMMNSLSLTSNTKIVVGALAAVITNAFDWIHTTIIADAWVYLTVLDSSLFCHVFNKQTFKGFSTKPFDLFSDKLNYLSEAFHAEET